MKRKKKAKKFLLKNLLSLEGIAIISVILSIILLSVGLYLLPSWLGSRLMIIGSMFLWVFIISAFIIAIKE